MPRVPVGCSPSAACQRAIAWTIASVSTASPGRTVALTGVGVLHLLDAETGAHVKEFDLSGYGRAGASLGSTHSGKMRVFVPVSGRGGAPNRLVCLGVD